MRRRLYLAGLIAAAVGEGNGANGLAFGLPPLSTWFFSCRHTFEETLVSEIAAKSPPGAAAKCGLVAPGLLRVEGEVLGRGVQSRQWDLTYALQVLPDAHLIGFDQASIGDLAKEAVAAVGLDAGGKRFDDLRKGQKGALAVHALVPDQVAKRVWQSTCIYLTGGFLILTCIPQCSSVARPSQRPRCTADALQSLTKSARP